MTYQDYAAAHRKQQIDIWSAIESGELQKAVNIFAAGIQYQPHNPDRKTGDKMTLTKRRKSGIMKLLRVLSRKTRRKRK